jgi:alkyl hydroperoxide reductase subunit AhpC
MAISRDYGVFMEDEGIALRGLFIIDPKGILRQITVNDLPVGRSVEETVRLIQAFQFTVRYYFLVQLVFLLNLFTSIGRPR